jgi:hypothetical protein
MVTVSPTYPLAALMEPPLRVICGVMVKLVVAETPPALRVTVCVPAVLSVVLAGTAKVTPAKPFPVGV